jgi:ubiquinone/menaquinone biosynthesis C-methylase UbiE
MDEPEQPWPDAVVQAEAGWRNQSAASAANYERMAVPAISRPWAERLLHRLAPAPGTRLLDLACGTGAVAYLAAGHVGPSGLVVGLDISPAMLAVAQVQPAAAGAPVHWQLGTAAVLPYRAAAFDAAACGFGLMFIPDRSRVLAEVRRVLAPGGRLAVSVWGNEAGNPVDSGLIAVLSRYAGAGVAARQAVGHALGAPGELRRLLAAAAFRSVVVDSLAGEHRIALAGMLNRVVTPHMDDATRTAAQHDWLAVLQPYIDGDQVRYPVTAYLAIAVA